MTDIYTDVPSYEVLEFVPPKTDFSQVSNPERSCYLTISNDYLGNFGAKQGLFLVVEFKDHNRIFPIFKLGFGITIVYSLGGKE